ncbi:MAG: HDIG domain-containing protein [Desulfobacterota bacterium]|nr:HDIG domain-containing protein [Thermodesulfobacteriota bacterium]
MENRIPDRDECYALITAYRMLPHIQQHSQAVCAVAVCIARTLNTKGFHFNLAEVQAAALLHDITKTQSLQTGEDHAMTGAELLASLGFHRIAHIVRQHINPDSSPDTISVEELISYADKRVLHDRPVSLRERFDYLLQRYGKTESAVHRINQAFRRTREIEQKIMHALNLENPDDICTADTLMDTLL